MPRCWDETERTLGDKMRKSKVRQSDNNLTLVNDTVVDIFVLGLTIKHLR